MAVSEPTNNLTTGLIVEVHEDRTEVKVPTRPTPIVLKPGQRFDFRFGLYSRHATDEPGIQGVGTLFDPVPDKS